MDNKQCVHVVEGHLIERRLLWVAKWWFPHPDYARVMDMDWHPKLNIFEDGGSWGAKCRVYVMAASEQDATAQAKQLFEQQSSEVG